MDSLGGGTVLCFIGVTIVIGFIVLASAIRVVPDYLCLVVLRLGRPLDKPKGPGIVFLIPMIDRAVKVDLREQKREVSDQTARTQDSVPVLFSFCWHYKILDPVKSIVQVGNQETATAGNAITILRAFIGGTNSTDILTSLESINAKARTMLDEVTNRWGVKVTNFETLKIIVDENRKEMDKTNFNIGT